MCKWFKDQNDISIVRSNFFKTDKLNLISLGIIFWAAGTFTIKFKVPRLHAESEERKTSFRMSTNLTYFLLSSSELETFFILKTITF